MSLQDFLQYRRQWAQQAPAAAAALDSDSHEPARELLSHWRFSGDRGLSRALLEQLSGLELEVAPAAMGMTLGEGVLSDVATAHDWRGMAFQAGLPAPEVAPRAWALAELAALGWLVEETARAPWSRVRVQQDDAADAQAAQLWRAWGDMRIFAHEDAWEKLTLKPMLRGFAAVLRGRRVPEDRLKLALADAREGWFPYLYGGDAESMSWRELAVRVLEAGGPGGPVDALAAALPPPRWELVARCAVTRGYGPDSARLVWGERSAWLVQARELQRRGAERPDSLGDLLDLHLASRLVQRWQRAARTAPHRSWNVVRNNRGRARARLRAVLRESPPQLLLERLLALPGLAWRTRLAAARFGKDWAWQCHQHGLTFADGRTLDPACHMPVPHVVPYTDDEVAQLQAWVLNVLLKGRLPHLDAWCSRKSADGIDLKDAAWGRLLSDEIPGALRSAGPDSSRDDGLQRLRAELVEHLPGILQRLTPVIAAVAEIHVRPRRTRQPFEVAVAPVVRPEVKPLRVQYRRYVDNARAILPQLQARLDHQPDEEDQ